ncbi:MAG: ABC transporter substrate-binding protein [Enterocloster sp.]
MKRGMRLAWGLLASAAVAAMTACGNQDAGDMDKTAAGTTGQMQSEETETAVSEEEALEDRMLTVAVFEDTGTLNPYTGESPAYALDWVYEGLTAMENGVPVPELALEWEISGDGLTYTFHLRPDVKFSDGSPFTAENAKRNMDLVLGHREYYPYLPSLAAVSSVEAADETTLTVHLTAPAPSLLNDLAGSYPFGMMGDEGFAAEGDVYQSAGALAEPEEENGFSTLGTGMWKLKTYVEGEYSVFERNEAYWGEKPGFRYLRTVVCSSAEEAAEAMKAGEADMVDSG